MNRRTRTLYSIQQPAVKSTKRFHKRDLRRIFLLLPVLCLLFTSGIFFSNAQAKEMDSSYKLYKNVMLEYGMTLTDVAGQYADDTHYSDAEDYIEEVLLINHLQAEEEAKAGMYLVVPYYAKEDVTKQQ